MKRLLFLVICMMTLSIADSFAQNIHYQLDKKGELYVVPDSAVKDVEITFTSRVPDSIKRHEKILTQLRRDGKYELSSEQIRGGKFESILLYYIPRYEKKVLISCITEDKGMQVSYDEYETYGNTIFNWLYSILLLSILLIVWLYSRYDASLSPNLFDGILFFLCFALGIGIAVVIGISLKSIVIGISFAIIGIAIPYIVLGEGNCSRRVQKISMGVYISLALFAGILAYCYGIGITPL